MQAQENAINKLEEVFAAFNRVGAELDSRYRELETQVARLSRELAAARSAKLRELAEKERLAARLGALMDALPGGVLVLDAEDLIREENPGARQLLGGSALGLSWSRALARAGAGAIGYGGETALDDGRRLACSSSTPAANGERILLLTDVSENHRQHEQRSRDKRLSALGEMSARLAHQVRTPLSAALLYLSHLRPADEAGRETQARIRGRLRQIDTLVESMLSFIRGESAGAQAFCLAALLREAAESAAPQVREAGGSLALDLPARDCRVEGNRQALFNALGNLIDNALRAADAMPAVRLTLRAAREGYEILVQDNGRGIEPGIRDHIFDPFFSTHPGGTGLGLAVAASTVKAHGGEIGVCKSGADGSVFRLLLPRKAAVNRGDGLWSEAAPAPATQRGRRA